MWHVFRSMGHLLWQLSYTPAFIKNSFLHHAHAWFPTVFAPVCRSGDFTCYHSNGLMKLADILPTKVMDGLDLLADNNGKVITGLLIGGASALTLYWRYKRFHYQEPALKRHRRAKQRPRSL